MESENKTKKELMDELEALQGRVYELERQKINFGRPWGILERERTDPSRRRRTYRRPYLSFSTESLNSSMTDLPRCSAYRRKRPAVLTLIP